VTVVQGTVEPGFGLVADAFEENFELGLETGAAVAIFDHGQLVVDIYAGVADERTNQEWNADTLAVAFSMTKGLMAICGYIAQQRGLIDFDQLVAAVWPEFAQHGKEQTTIRDLFSHRAGLFALDADLTLEDVANWIPIIAAIERQEPRWVPGAEYAYHALTYGWLTGEVLRRVTGLRPSQLVTDYVTEPLGVDAWIGLPRREEPRVAHVVDALPSSDPAFLAAQDALLSRPLVVKSITLGSAFPTFANGGSFSDFNSPTVHGLEVPAANGILTAKSLAEIYSATVSNHHGPRLLSEASVADALVLRSSGKGWSGYPQAPGIRFSTGFMLNGYPTRQLLSDSSFGHDGASGGLGFADADAEVGFGYVNNQMANRVDERANRITDALRKCLDL
jgi:CubicO group peptidase (beta-lactamase class C family)